MNAKTKLKKNKARTAFIYISIAYPLLHFLVFNIGMNLGMVYNSFFQENLIGEKIYCGFYQYADVFKSFTGLKDQGGMYTYRAVLNTFSLIPLSLIVNMPLSLLFAYAVFRKYALYRSFRVVLFVPAVISAVVLCLSFQMALDVNYGFIALLFKKMGIRVPVYGYFGHEKVAWWSILVFSVWTGISTNLVYFCSAMGRLPGVGHRKRAAGRCHGMDGFRQDRGAHGVADGRYHFHYAGRGRVRLVYALALFDEREIFNRHAGTDRHTEHAGKQPSRLYLRARRIYRDYRHGGNAVIQVGLE